jgi:hypothetical protein
MSFGGRSRRPGQPPVPASPPGQEITNWAVRVVRWPLVPRLRQPAAVGRCPGETAAEKTAALSWRHSLVLTPPHPDPARGGWLQSRDRHGCLGDAAV